MDTSAALPVGIIGGLVIWWLVGKVLGAGLSDLFGPKK